MLSATLIPSTEQLAAIDPPSIPGFSFDAFSIVASASPSTVTLTSGPYASLNSISTPYTITVQASGINSDSGTVRLSQILQDQQIPLFQFGVYYNNDLEIFPGPTMTFNGRVHSNANIYLGGNAVVDSSISSAGAIFRCRKDNPLDCDSAEIRTPSNTLLDLDYDHSDPDWVNRAYSDWGGLVQDMAHGVQALNLPVEAGDLFDLIKQGDAIDPVPHPSHRP